MGMLKLSLDKTDTLSWQRDWFSFHVKLGSGPSTRVHWPTGVSRKLRGVFLECASADCLELKSRPQEVIKVPSFSARMRSGGGSNDKAVIGMVQARVKAYLLQKGVVSYPKPKIRLHVDKGSRTVTATSLPFQFLATVERRTMDYEVDPLLGFRLPDFTGQFLRDLS